MDKNNETYDDKPNSSVLDYHQTETLDQGAMAVVPRKHFSTLALIGLSFAILNSWTAASAAINLALGAGGPVGVVYGLLVGTICASTVCTVVGGTLPYLSVDGWTVSLGVCYGAQARACSSGLLCRMAGCHRLGRAGL